MKTRLYAMIALLAALNMSAGRLWIIGEATPFGWSLDDATAILSTTDNPELNTGTIYLKSSGTFKFMTGNDWGQQEFGAEPGATLTDGTIKLATGSNDEGYSQISVPESGNYLLKVNTADMTAEITLSGYQGSEITTPSLFMVGSATAGGWSVMDGTPLYQNPEAPYEYKNSRLSLQEGTFKIATALKGASSFDARYFYFRDASDNNKIALAQDGDLQWEIPAAGEYNITVNTLANTITIAKSQSGIVEVTAADSAVHPAQFYSIDGRRVENPTSGLYIRVSGSETSKVFIR